MGRRHYFELFMNLFERIRAISAIQDVSIWRVYEPISFRFHDGCIFVEGLFQSSSFIVSCRFWDWLANEWARVGLHVAERMTNIFLPVMTSTILDCLNKYSASCPIDLQREPMKFSLIVLQKSCKIYAEATHSLVNLKHTCTCQDMSPAIFLR